MKKIKLLLIISFSVASFTAEAQINDTMQKDEYIYVEDSLRRTYSAAEKWYFQVQAGVNYNLAENTRFVPSSKIVAPAFALSVGKKFTPLWGARVQVMMGKDNGVYYDHRHDSPLFSFEHFGLIAEGTFNFSNLVRGVNTIAKDNYKWNFDLKLGVGIVHSCSYELSKDVVDYPYIDPKPRNNLTVYAGMDVSRKIAKDWDINLEVGINRLPNLYNSQWCRDKKSEVIGDLLPVAMIGIRYTIPRCKPCKSRVVYVEVPKYIPVSQPIEIEEPDAMAVDTLAVSKKPCYDIDELLQMVAEGKSIRGLRLCNLEMVHFDFDKDNIKPEFALYLDKLATLLVNQPDVKLLVMGHTDIRGSVEYNYDLSYRRSQNVMKYLNKKGISYDRMFFSYYSKLSPYTENVSDGGRAINRRVEFMIMP